MDGALHKNVVSSAFHRDPQKKEKKEGKEKNQA